MNFNPELDLILERFADVPKERIFEAWTNPELMKQWFTPRPWRTSEVVLELRPGGIFKTTMNGPDGEEFSGEGCVLEVIPNQRFAWTSALGENYRPNPPMEGAFTFSAFIDIEDYEGGSKYTARVYHSDKEGKEKHEAMGFHGGWGTAFDQLVEMVKAQS